MGRGSSYVNSHQRSPLAAALLLCIGTAICIPHLTHFVVAAAILPLMFMLAAGWPSLLNLPSKRGSSLIIALSGVGALALNLWRYHTIHATHLVLAMVALSIFCSFIHEMCRKSRKQLTLSISGTASGALLSIIAVNWLQGFALAEHNGNAAIKLLIVLVFASAASMLCLTPPLSNKIRVPLAVFASIAVAWGMAFGFGFTISVTVVAALAALCMSSAALSLIFLLERVVGALKGKQYLAVAAAPVAIIGIFSVLFIRIAVSYFPTDMGLSIFENTLGK